jgi:hypothetical protein
MTTRIFLKATIRLLLSSLLGFDPRRYRDNLDQSPAALNIVDFKSPVRARLTLFNDTSHCSQAGIAIPGLPNSRLSKWWAETEKRPDPVTSPLKKRDAGVSGVWPHTSSANYRKSSRRVVSLVDGVAFRRSPFSQIATVVSDPFESRDQWDVAHLNRSGKSSRFTRRGAAFTRDMPTVEAAAARVHSGFLLPERSLLHESGTGKESKGCSAADTLKLNPRPLFLLDA